MAKSTSPLMSMQASGTIGARLTFSVRSSGQQVRLQKAQKNLNTPLQIVERDRYSASVQSWNELDPTAQQAYNTLAIKMNMTGYNLFMKGALPEVEGLLGSFELGFSFLGLA